MQILVMEIQLSASWCHSLKDKRKIVKGLIEQLKHKFNISVAEIDFQDNHRRIAVGIAAVVPHRAMADAIADRIEAFIASRCEAEITEVCRDLL